MELRVGRQSLCPEGHGELLCRTLSGHCQGRAIGVENTATAVSVLRENQIDLIVQDLFRPHGNGLDFLATLGSDPQLSRIPVIVLSGQCGWTGSMVSVA